MNARNAVIPLGPLDLQPFDNKMSYAASAASPYPLCGLTYGEIVDARAILNGNQVFITDRTDGTSTTFAQFKEMVDDTARALIALGVEKGDRVAMLGMNSAHWIVIQFAAPTIGAWFVNLNAAFPESQLGRMIDHCDPKVIISQSHHAHSNYFDMLRNLHARSPSESGGKRILVTAAGCGSADGLLDWQEFIDRGRAVATDELKARKDSVQSEDINMICYTGGTSGVLKGALRTHMACVNSPYKNAVSIGLDSSSVICTSFLFFHTAGMNGGTTLAMMAGSRIVIPAPGFDVNATLAALYEENCTHYSGVPTTLKSILDHPDFDINRLKLKSVTTGGTGCVPDLMDRVRREMRIKLFIAYGGTEAGTLCMTMPDDPEDLQISTVGMVGCHSEMKVIDPETGRTVRRGMAGEVCSRGPFVMRGYYKLPDLTAKLLDSDRWYHSGDVGVMDENGYLRIIGRIDEMIIRGGENVQPTDVESVIGLWPGVTDVQVVGVPDDKYGHEIAAWVVADGTCDDEALRAHCKTYLAYYQVPKWFFFVPSFPLTGVGKPDRAKLKVLARERVSE